MQVALGGQVDHHCDEQEDAPFLSQAEAADRKVHKGIDGRPRDEEREQRDLGSFDEDAGDHDEDGDGNGHCLDLLKPCDRPEKRGDNASAQQGGICERVRSGHTVDRPVP